VDHHLIRERFDEIPSPSMCESGEGRVLGGSNPGNRRLKPPGLFSTYVYMKREDQNRSGFLFFKTILTSTGVRTMYVEIRHRASHSSRWVVSIRFSSVLRAHSLTVSHHRRAHRALHRTQTHRAPFRSLKCDGSSSGPPLAPALSAPEGRQRSSRRASRTGAE
jgi:hypothetical protein